MLVQHRLSVNENQLSLDETILHGLFVCLFVLKKIKNGNKARIPSAVLFPE
jgi:hypothetical protein